MSQPHIDAMKQALEEWEKPMSKGSLEAHRILRTAIDAAKMQEPVAWAVYCDGFIALPAFEDEQAAIKEMQRRDKKWPHNKREVRALYDGTPPAAQREPDDSFDIDDVAYALEAILQRAGEGATVGRVIALLENLAKPEQEPVEINWDAVHEKLCDVWRHDLSADEGLDEIQDLIATPHAAHRQPLTDEQIIGSWEKLTGKKLPNMGPSISQLIAYTRVVEAAHGIKENT